MVLDDWLRESRGKWAHLSCGLSVPRQNGKNAILEVRELFGVVGRGERILHTAHEVKTAQKHFRRLKHFFGNSADDPGAQYPELNALVETVRNVNGQEAVILRNGGSIEVIARSKNSGRGFTVDVLVMDEAQEMDDDALEALMPTTSAAPLGNPQWIFTGTPPGPKAAGEVFGRVRDTGLTKHARECWHEWSAEKDVDLDDRAVWALVNPALVTGRLQADVIEGERARFSDAGFARERLGMWDEAGGQQVIPADAWAACTDTGSTPAQRLVLAVDVAPDQSRASVALAGLRADGLVHVELYEQRDGMGWLAQWISDKCATHNVAAVVIDKGSTAGPLVDELARRKVKHVVPVGFGEHADACSSFYQTAIDGRLRHTGQPQLTAALAGARKRLSGDRWLWNRKNATADITPIVAATLAVWGVGATRVKSRGPARGPRRIY